MRRLRESDKKEITLLWRHNSYIFSPAKPPGAACARDVSADAKIPTGTALYKSQRLRRAAALKSGIVL